MNDNFLKVLHFYGLHTRDERQLFKGFTLLWSSPNKKPEFFKKELWLLCARDYQSLLAQV